MLQRGGFKFRTINFNLQAKPFPQVRKAASLYG